MTALPGLANRQDEGTVPSMLTSCPPIATKPDAYQAYIERVVAKAPPLSLEQQAKIGTLLSPVAIRVGPRRRGVRHEPVAA